MTRRNFKKSILPAPKQHNLNNLTLIYHNFIIIVIKRKGENEMFCASCGKVINLKPNEKRCPYCGRLLPQHINYDSRENNLATQGFALSVFIATTAIFLNIIVYMEILELWAIILICVLELIIGVTGIIVSFKGLNKTKYYAFEQFAKWGIALSIFAILLTLIFMIVDIVELYTVGFVPVHSSINQLILY